MKPDPSMDKKNSIICPLCQKLNESHATQCRFCSADFNGMTVCPQCFYEQGVKNNFCRKCMHPLKKGIKFYTHPPSSSPAFSSDKRSLPVIIFFTGPAIAFFLLARVKTPRAQFAALLIMIISTFLLLKRTYRR